MKELTTAEAAKYLGVQDSRIRQLILRGQLVANKRGRDWAIPLKSLRARQAELNGRSKRRKK